VRYLLGDSSEAGLEFNYLAFLKEVIDCSVVLLEHESTLTSAGDKRRSLEKDANVVLAALDELSRRTTELAEVVATEQADNAIGRCAETIVKQTREAVEKESAGVREALAADVARVEKEDLGLRSRGMEIVEKLLKSHELPGAEKTIEVTWTSTKVAALARQKTPYGIDATVGLELPAGTDLVPDLRVERLAEHAELSALEVGGWLKKSDKLVPYKIGRYHIVKLVTTGGATGSTLVRLRSTAETTSGGFDLVMTPKGEISVENVTGEPVRELTVDSTNKPAIDAMLKKLDTAARALGDHRTGTVSLSVDGKPFNELPRTGVVAERLIGSVAPMVHKIAQHSRSPGELVLRRMLGEDRREEIFVPVADLTRRWANLPPAGKEVFAPLRLEVDPAAPLPEHSGPQRRPVTSGPVDRSAPPSGAAAGGVPASARPAAPPAPPQRTATIPPVSSTMDTKSVTAKIATSTPSTSVTTQLPKVTSETPSASAAAGQAALAAAWAQPAPDPVPSALAPGTVPPAPGPAAQAAAAAAAPPPRGLDESGSIQLDDEALAEELDEIVEEPPSQPQKLEMLPSVAEAVARAANSPETRQARLELLNDPVKYARLSAAIEAALGEIEDEEAPPSDGTPTPAT